MMCMTELHRNMKKTLCNARKCMMVVTYKHSGVEEGIGAKVKI